MKGNCFNKTIIIGRLGENPKLVNKKYASFMLRTTTIDGKSGKETVMRHKIIVCEKQRDIVMSHLRKGDLCCIEGRLTQDVYEKRSNVICAERITFLSPARPKETEAEVQNEKA